jgi:hypothetical protein
MAFVDSNEFEIFYWVHPENRKPMDGDEFSEEADAIEAAKDAAKYDPENNFTVTCIMEKVIGTAKLEVTFER